MAQTIYEYEVQIRSQYGHWFTVRISAPDQQHAKIIAESQYGRDNVGTIGNYLG